MPCKGKRYRKTGDSYEKDIYIHLKSLLEYLLCYLGTELYLKKKKITKVIVSFLISDFGLRVYAMVCTRT